MTKEELQKEILRLLDKNKVKMSYDFSFPLYRILPDEVQLALKVLSRHGMKIIFKLEDKK